jgi:serine/threonine-protein kinase
VLELFAPIIDTLQAAHGLGFIHRDIRPANIFVLEGSACGAVRLLFSIVKVGTKFSDPGQGTPVYTAPEVWRGQPELVDHQLDVFSLGATLFRVLAGHVPFVGLTRVDAVMAVMRGPEPSLSSLRPDLPPEIDAWTERALALHPGARFPDVRSLWDALTPLLGQSA